MVHDKNPQQIFGESVKKFSPLLKGTERGDSSWPGWWLWDWRMEGSSGEGWHDIHGTHPAQNRDVC